MAGDLLGINQAIEYQSTNPKRAFNPINSIGAPPTTNQFNRGA
jgi:hypothetical protein